MTREDRQRAIEASAFVLLGRAEASGGTETDQLRRALMLALEDKVKMEEEVRAELAELRRQKQMGEKERDDKLKAVRADVERAEKRAEGAEADLSRVRSEAIRMQQEVKSKKMEVEDKEDGYNAEIGRLKREAEEMMARLQVQGIGMESVSNRPSQTPCPSSFPSPYQYSEPYPTPP